MKRRLLSVFLSLCMMLTLAPAAFAAEPGDPSENAPVEITETDGTAQEPITSEDTAPTEPTESTEPAGPTTPTDPETTEPTTGGGQSDDAELPTEEPTAIEDKSENEDAAKIAQIGETQYSSLSEAISAATNNETAGEKPVTIELIDNVTGTAQISIPVGANLVIDGKEHTFNGSISCVANSSQANKAAAVDGDEKDATHLTIQNLKMNGEEIVDGFGIYSGN